MSRIGVPVNLFIPGYKAKGISGDPLFSFMDTGFFNQDTADKLGYIKAMARAKTLDKKPYNRTISLFLLNSA